MTNWLFTATPAFVIETIRIVVKIEIITTTVLDYGCHINEAFCWGNGVILAVYV